MIQILNKMVEDHHSLVTQVLTVIPAQVPNLPQGPLFRVQLENEHWACDHCVARRRSVPWIHYMDCFGGFRIILKELNCSRSCISSLNWRCQLDHKFDQKHEPEQQVERLTQNCSVIIH